MTANKPVSAAPRASRDAAVLRLLVLVLVLSGAAETSCARHAGQNATAGAAEGMRTIREESLQQTGQYPAQLIGGRVARGVVEEITSDEQARRLEALVAQTARSAEQGMARELSDDLGLEGQGPLGTALAATSQKVSDSAARGLVTSLFPECDGSDARCIDRRFADLGQAVGSGLVRGFKSAIPWALVVALYLAGVLTTLIVVMLWRLLRRIPVAEVSAPRAPKRPAET